MLKTDSNKTNSIIGVMVNVLASNVIDRWFESLSGQTNDYKIVFSCFSSKHADLGRKSEYWLARNQNNVSAYSDMAIRDQLYKWSSTIKIQLSVLV
jgi:hypothetical protein